MGVVFFFFNPSKQHLNSSQTVFVSKTWIDDLFTEQQAENRKLQGLEVEDVLLFNLALNKDIFLFLTIL